MEETHHHADTISTSGANEQMVCNLQMSLTCSVS